MRLAARVVGRKWASALLWLIARGTNRFGAIRRALPQIAPQVLTVQLRALERSELIRRVDRSTKVAHVEYVLTPSGERARSMIDAMAAFGRAHRDTAL